MRLFFFYVFHFPCDISLNFSASRPVMSAPVRGLPGSDRCNEIIVATQSQLNILCEEFLSLSSGLRHRKAQHLKLKLAYTAASLREGVTVYKQFVI